MDVIYYNDAPKYVGLYKTSRSTVEQIINLDIIYRLRPNDVA